MTPTANQLGLLTDFGSSPGAGGGAAPPVPSTPTGVSFIIQIGLTRESVLLPHSADLAYVKQIACSIVDQKVSPNRGSSLSYTSLCTERI